MKERNYAELVGVLRGGLKFATSFLDMPEGTMEYLLKLIANTEVKEDEK